jgi:hypothetical protein
MKKYIVCNVSDQTIPTVLFIKEMHQLHQIDSVIFIHTKYSAKKVEHILEACPEIMGKIIPIELPGADSIKDIKKILDLHFDKSEFSDAFFLVDITCGTKIMSISLYESLKEFTSEIFYINIDKESYRRVYPGNQREEIDFNYKIPLGIYLKAYGAQISAKSRAGFSINILNKFFQQYKNSATSKLLSDLRIKANQNPKPKNRDKPYFNIAELKGLRKLCDILNYKEELLSIKQIKFLTGGWFEEYIFDWLKELLTENRALSCIIEKSDSKVKNEFDVIFILRNRLYIIEAKTNFQGRHGLANDTLYKSKALEKEFGLRTKTILATLDEEYPKKRSFLDRAELMDVTLMFQEQLDPENILSNFKKILGV